MTHTVRRFPEIAAGTLLLAVSTGAAAAGTILPTTAIRVQAGVTEMAERHRRFLEEEVAYLISETERRAFLSLSGEDTRDAFVEAFWQRRDPNPTTPENEYRDEHFERLAYANEFYGRDTGRAGWRTDRGRFHIVLGPPRTKEDYSHSDALYPIELWFYNDPALRDLGVPAFFHLLFFRRFGAGEMRLYSPVEDGPESLLTGYRAFRPGDFRNNLEDAYNDIHAISPELASAALSFRTDEGTNFSDLRGFGTVSLLEEIARAPTYGLDTSYAERFDLESVESDYLFHYAPSAGFHQVLPGPGGYFVHWAVEMPPSSVVVVRDPERGRYGAVFIATIEITNSEVTGSEITGGETTDGEISGGADGEIVLHSDRAESYFSLGEDEATALRRPFLFRGAAPVIPGEHRLRVIVRNRACAGRDEADCRRSYTLHEGPFTVPELQFDHPDLTEPVPVSGSERLGGEPLYRAYRFGGLRLDPNPQRVYPAGGVLLLLSEPLNAPPEARVVWEVIPNPAAPANAPPAVPAAASPNTSASPEASALLPRVAGETPAIGGRTPAIGGTTPAIGGTTPAIGGEAPAIGGETPAAAEREGPLLIRQPLDGLPAGRYRAVVRLVRDETELARREVGFSITPRAVVPRPAVDGGLGELRVELGGVVELSRARQYLALGNEAYARAFAEAAVEAGPNLAEARDFLAGRLLAADEPAAAAELLVPLFEADPDRYLTARRLGEARLRSGDFEGAAAPLDRALALRPPDADLLVLAATVRLVRGDEQGAAALLDRAHALDPENEAVLALRSGARRRC